MSKLRRLLFVAVLVVGGVLAAAGWVSQPARAGAWIVLSEGFETGIAAWTVSDENPASGLDYWGISASRAHSGTSSVWCAQVGTSGVNGQPNAQNEYYDQDMDANLIASLGDVSGYSTVTLLFWYWAVTGSFSLADFLSAWYFAGGSWSQVWSQPSVSSGGWQQVSVTVPNAATAVGFVFHSDPTVRLGPYEGVYVDDITVIGIDSTPPQSSASALPPYIGTRDFLIGFSASDNTGGSGLLSVTLYYRIDGGTWTSFPGTYSASPITFVAPADGTFDFYTVATDRSGNVEATPAAPDTSAVVDTQVPTLTISQPTESQWIGSTTVGVAWSATDSGSGIARYTVSLDRGSSVDVGTSLSYTFNRVTEGSHTAAVTAIDRAGNSAQGSIGFGVDVTDPSVTINLPAAGRDVVESNVVVSWAGSDSGSGIDHYEVRLDSGASVRITSGTIYTFSSVDDGPHTITVKAVDVAGNTREESIAFRVNTNWVTGGGPSGWLPMIALILGILVIVLVLVAWWRKRLGTVRAPPPSDQSPPSTPPPEGGVEKRRHPGLLRLMESLVETSAPVVPPAASPAPPWAAAPASSAATRIGRWRGGRQ